MGKTHTLRLMLDRFTVHNGVFKIVDNRLVDGMTLPLLVCIAMP